jgi:translin
MMVLDYVRKFLEEREKAREELLKLTREMRINATKSVMAVHAGKLNDAKRFVEKAIEVLEKVVEFKKYPEIYYPITHDAMQELVEAYALMKVMSGESFWEIELEVEPASVLTGLADLIGELRRLSLDSMRKGEVEKAEKYLNIMEEIYAELITFSFPDKLTPGLRFKLDSARQSLERTKSDLLSAKLLASLKDK